MDPTVLTRRTAGVLVLVAAVVGSLLVSRIGGSRVVGTAIARPGVGAPAVGDCLAAIVGPPALPNIIAAPPSPVSISTVGETAVTFADCAVPHIGEVVAYRALSGPTANYVSEAAGAPASSAAPTATPAASAVSDGQWCQGVAAGYRRHSLARFGSALDAVWAPSTGQRFAAVLSAPTLDPAAPRWAACAFLSPGLEVYSGSYVRSLADLPAPPPFGLCRSGDPADSWVSCAAPHRTQEFGTAVRMNPSSPAALDGCHSLIELMTRMTDITDGGALRVEINGGADVAGGGPLDKPDAAAVASCRLSVVGDDKLVGTLVGVGDRPLPLG